MNHKCSKCKFSLGKENFYPSNTRAPGVSAYCKKCYREIKREWRDKNRTHVRVKSMETKMKNYEKVLARNYCWLAIRKGKLKRKNCEVCQSPKNIQAHHYLGYSLENRLKVKWLCMDCHKKIEKQGISVEDFKMAIPLVHES